MSASWLKNAIFYEIYPQSFCDTNGDGIGDLNGITEKLDYIKSLGCNALWLNPIYDSPFKDAGYDVRDHKKLASRYFHPLEQAYLEKDPWEGFFRIWTAKESFVKRTGRGIDHHLSELCILPDGDAWQDGNGFFRQTRL
jgi:1,4-alpha-glucan branching enzyme